jgi:hypothetical protein
MRRRMWMMTGTRMMMSNRQEVGGPKVEKSLQQVGTDSPTAARDDIKTPIYTLPGPSVAFFFGRSAVLVIIRVSS